MHFSRIMIGIQNSMPECIYEEYFCSRACVCVYVSTTCDRKYKRILVLIFILVRSSFTYFVFNKDIRFSVYQKVCELLFVCSEDDQQDSHFERVNVCYKKKRVQQVCYRTFFSLCYHVNYRDPVSHFTCVCKDKVIEGQIKGKKECFEYSLLHLLFEIQYNLQLYSLNSSFAVLSLSVRSLFLQQVSFQAARGNGMSSFY